MSSFNGSSRLNASIPREFTPAVKQHANDLNLTPSNFIALCVEAALEMMDAENTPALPYFIGQYRFLKQNSQLKSQQGKGSAASSKSALAPAIKKSLQLKQKAA
ncbi:MAG: hypothetical protein V1746_06285 [bacterium]